MIPFVPNPNFAEEIAGSEETLQGLTELAERAKPIFEAAARDAGAPWMPRAGHETIEVQADETGVYIVNTDHGGHLMEFGSVNNPVFAPLRRGAGNAGLRLEEPT